MCLRLCLLFATIGIFLIFYFELDHHIDEYGFQMVQRDVHDSEEELFSTCTLEEFGDGWTQEVLRIANVLYDPIKKCNESFKPMTVLDENGTLYIHKDHKDIDCQARSVLFKNDRRLNYDNWTDLTHEASDPWDADIIQTQCFARTKPNATKVEDWLHIQVVKQDHIKEDAKGEEHAPSVYIFVVDSVSHSQAVRSLPKTLSLLQKEFDAVTLRHVNKVGENSRPNGLALFFGKTTGIDRSLFGRENVKPDWNKSTNCHGYLDEQGFLLSEFTKKGYASLMAEDWAQGVFNYPSCKGFQNPPTTHYMRPFQLHYEHHKRDSRKFQGIHQCLETQAFLYQYQDEFIKRYPKSSKIALTWTSNVAHDEPSNLFHYDGQMFNYFRKHRKEFDKSFVVFMGDHGLRFGSVRYTAIGRKELNNPMLVISVPRHLREKLVPTLQENADKLLTSYDTHASFKDILQDPTFESAPPQLAWGNSLFRRLPEGERSCRTLPIPLRFCMCEWNRTAVSEEKEKEEIGRLATDLLNGRLREENITSSCQSFTYDGRAKIQLIVGTRGIHNVIFKTKQCGAFFSAIVRVEKDHGAPKASLISDDFTRTNSYGKTAECMNSRAELKPLCCCKSKNT